MVRSPGTSIELYQFYCNVSVFQAGSRQPEILFLPRVLNKLCDTLSYPKHVLLSLCSFPSSLRDSLIASHGKYISYPDAPRLGTLSCMVYSRIPEMESTSSGCDLLKGSGMGGNGIKAFGKFFSQDWVVCKSTYSKHNPIFQCQELYLNPKTGSIICRIQCQMKMWGSLFQIIKDFKIVTVEP